MEKGPGQFNPDMETGELKVEKTLNNIKSAIETIGEKNPEVAETMLKTFERLTRDILSQLIRMNGDKEEIPSLSEKLTEKMNNYLKEINIGNIHE